MSSVSVVPGQRLETEDMLLGFACGEVQIATQTTRQYEAAKLKGKYIYFGQSLNGQVPFTSGQAAK